MAWVRSSGIRKVGRILVAAAGSSPAELVLDGVAWSPVSEVIGSVVLGSEVLGREQACGSK